MKVREGLSKARKILGIQRGATADEVKKRYRELARKWHPDINPDHKAGNRMQEINKSYEAVMKEEFGIIDPWDDYDKWWWKQYSNDPVWGDYSSEESGKTNKYACVRNTNLCIESSRKNNGNSMAKDFLNKHNVFAVVGVSKNPKKYGNKIYRELKFGGYTVYPLNPRVEEIEGDKCYPSLGELPKIPDVVDIVVPPDIAYEVVKQAVGIGIKKIWLQPGSESEEIINYCKKHGISVLHDICIILEGRRHNYG